ncbi:tyrosine-type recombinase/integrase [Oricola indica]|uniref:tyrosine-type recombinase/integrase n=1 Tax=Oricola indica TaxID=2872591 RepID=UPI003CCBEB78
MAKLTKRTVSEASADEKDIFLWDDDLPGYGLKVTPKGRKVFVLQYRIGGRSRRMTLGRFGNITAEQARTDAQSALRRIARGEDPMFEKDQKREEQRVGELLERFLSSHADAKLKERSRMEYRRLLDKLFPKRFRQMPITEITRRDVAALHHSLAKTPYQANRLLAVLRKFFNWCEKNGYRPDHTNPAHHIEKFKENRRERFLSEAELARLGAVLGELEAEDAHSPFIIGAVRLLVLTGARLNEILSLRWQWVDFKDACLRLPDSKTGAKTIYLNAPALDVLSRLPHLEDNPHVICGQKQGGRLVNLQKPWTAIRSKAGLNDVRLHDLRHSFASVAVASGMSLPLIGALLGHSQPQTTARYAHLSDDPIRKASTAIGERMRVISSHRKASGET